MTEARESQETTADGDGKAFHFFERFLKHVPKIDKMLKEKMQDFLRKYLK